VFCQFVSRTTTNFVFCLVFFLSKPLFVRQDISTHFQFRIRNLPYEYENYILEIDDSNQEIILKTKNKKYYKRMSIPDLKAGVGETGKLNMKYLNYKHANNTLIISYVKPPFILDLEAKNKVEIKKMGNGSTSVSGSQGSSSANGTNDPSKPTTAAQALLAEARQESQKAKDAEPEFGGLNGLKGLAKNQDCKQQ
jgi:hypothetical protein